MGSISVLSYEPSRVKIVLSGTLSEEQAEELQELPVLTLFSQGDYVKLTLAAVSLLLFGLAVVLLLLLTVYESALLGMSPEAERIMTLLGLILPPGIGAVMGLISLMRRERRLWLAITGITLNTLFALFHLLIVLFAG